MSNQSDDLQSHLQREFQRRDRKADSVSVGPNAEVITRDKVNSIRLLVRGIDEENYTALQNPPLPSPPTASDAFEIAHANQSGRLHVA